LLKRVITDGFLRGVKPPGSGRIEIRDTHTRGLVLRLTAGGTASWSTRGLLPTGKHGRITLGTWPHVGIAEARRRAKAAVAGTQAGEDPIAEKRAARAAELERAALPTVAEAIEAWKEAKAERWRPSQAAMADRTMRLGVPPALAKQKLRETGRRDWVAAIEAAQARGPAAAASFYRYASSFLSWSEASGLIPTHPLPRKGAAQIAPAPEARERTLSDAELVAVWKASETLSAKPRAFVRLLILTGCRRAEVAGVMAGEVDLAKARWVIPAERAKNATARTIPLGPVAITALAPLMPAEPAPKCRLLGRYSYSPLSGFSTIKADLDAAAGVTDWTWHDLRRTCRTGLAKLGIDDAVAEAAIGHISDRSALVRTYDRHDRADEARAASLAWQSHVAALIAPPRAKTGRRTATVVKLRETGRKPTGRK